jgi:hypothetical protein
VSTITSTKIDWDSNCKFDELGNVVGFHRQDIKNNYSMKPVPHDEKILKLAREGKKVLDGVMKPASREEIALAVKKLSLHCGMQDRAPNDVKHMFNDYCEDLKQYSLLLINDACAAYRKSLKSSKFLPSSGELIALIKPRYAKLARMRDRINKILGEQENLPKDKKDGTVLLSDLL